MSKTTLNYQLLGRSGLRVSDLCLGTMTFGEDWGWGSPKSEARKVYDAYREAGGNFLDTANIYTMGTSEKIVGGLIEGHREEVVLSTKYSSAISPLAGKQVTEPNAGGNQRKSMVQSLEGSLKRLGTDYVDVFWLHLWDELTPAEEVMRAFDDLVRAGKVLYVGVSDTPAWWVSKSNTLAELHGWTRFVGMQMEYSLLERTGERELLPMAKDQDLTVLAWAPLKNGLLTGKYLPENARQSEKEDARLHSPMMKSIYGEGETDPGTEQTIREVLAIGQELGASPAQVALAWLRARPARVIPIIGARKLEQLEDNLASVDVTLTADQLARLDKSSAVTFGFPLEFLRMPAAQQWIFGDQRARIRA